MSRDEIEVRRAVAADAAILASLNRTVQVLHNIAEPRIFKMTSIDEIEAFFATRLSQPATHTFLPCFGTRAVGYVLATEIKKPSSPFKNDDRYLELDQIAVEPDFRRQGIGARLVHEVEAVARQLSLRVELSVSALNREALAFYESLGFQPILQRLTKSVDRGSSRE